MVGSDLFAMHHPFQWMKQLGAEQMQKLANFITTKQFLRWDNPLQSVSEYSNQVE